MFTKFIDQRAFSSPKCLFLFSTCRTAGAVEVHRAAGGLGLEEAAVFHGDPAPGVEAAGLQAKSYIATAQGRRGAIVARAQQVGEIVRFGCLARLFALLSRFW